MHERIYFDQAATSFPKAPGVAEAVADFITHQGVNVGRGAYQKAYDEEAALYAIRQDIAEFFGSAHPENVVFTNNVTQALNTVIDGYLKPGDAVFISGYEHNAVLRPLHARGIETTVIQNLPDGTLDLEQAEKHITDNTKAVIMSHASNVCGLIQPAETVGAFCRAHGLKFILDSAQTAGVVPIDVKVCGIDALCFTGHKGLGGPQGTGGIVFTDDMAAQTRPLLYGGTGSYSDLAEMPEIMPDKFEAGTLNLPGIFGLGAAVRWFKGQDLHARLRAEQALARCFATGIAEIDGLSAVGVYPQSTGVVSVVSSGKDLSEIAYALDERGVMTRVGLHCAPLAHKTLGTFPIGTLRFSFGPDNTAAQVDCALAALREITQENK